MTCIVGIVERSEDGDKVYIGADSAGVAGYSITVRKDRKVFRNGAYIMGGSGSFRMIQLLHYSFQPPEPPEDNLELDRFMSTRFVDELRNCLKDGGFAQVNSNQETGGFFLVGVHGWLFEIDSDYQVGEALAPFASIGCGAEIAKGVLYVTPDMQPDKRVKLALRAAEALNGGVRSPFYVEVL